MSLGHKNIEFHDHTEDFIHLLMKAKIRGLEAIGLAAEGHAKREITKQGAVDTGRLRNSITYALAGEFPHVKQYRAYRRSEGESRRKIYQYNGKMPGIRGTAVYIGSNVEYAPYVELGTVNMRARPFLRPAATEHAAEYKRLMEESIKNA